MKTMTCKQLGGVCDRRFQGHSFEEIAEMSKQHGIEMFWKGDKAHVEAMHVMKEFMHNPESMKVWLEDQRKKFEASLYE